MYYRIREHQSGPVDYTVTDAASTDPWFAGSTYRFAAVAVDEWGQSVPALSHPVVVRKNRR